MSKIGMQLAIHRTDQSKLFPMIVLPQNATLSYASHCAILGCFAQIRTASVLQAAGQLPNSPSSAHNRRGNKAERISGLGDFSSRTEAHSLDAIGLASAKGICHHQLGFINCLANRGEDLKGGD